MDIVGEIKLIFRDIDTGEITKEFDVCNHITDRYYDRMYKIVDAASGNELFNKIFIAYEEYERVGTQYESRIMGVHGYGYDSVGINNPTFVNPPFDASKKTPPYMEILQRFDPKPNDILINIIGLGNGSINSYYGFTDADAWVRLPNTSTQKTNETLDIYYRVFFNYDFDFEDPNDFSAITSNSFGISKDEAYQLMQRVCNTNSSSYQGYWYRFNLSPYAGNKNNKLFKYVKNTYTGAYTGVISYNSILYKNTKSNTFTINDQVGKVIGSLGLGNNSDVYSVLPLNFFNSGNDPIQNIFGHNSDAVVPFYDSSTINDSVGSLSVDGMSWTDTTFPKFFKISIDSSGATGISNYSFSVRIIFGFTGNNYNNLSTATMLYANGWNNFRFSKPYLVSGSTFNLNDPTTVMKAYNHKPYHILHVQKDDIMLMDVKLEEGFRVHNSTFPQFDATNIAGFDEEKGTGAIWVACRENGLYRIDNMWTNPSVTKITMPAVGSPNVLDRCLGVATTPQLGGSGVRVWALFSDLLGDLNQNSALGLYYSEDNGVTWVKDTTFNPSVGTYWTGSATEFLSMYGIWSDKNHPDCRIMVLYSEFKNYKAGDVTDNVWSMWHDAVSGTSDSYEVSNGYRGRLVSTGARPSGSWVYGNTVYDLDNSHILSAIYGVSENQNMWGVHRLTRWTTFIATVHGRIFNFRDPVYAGNANYSGTPSFSGFTVDANGNDALITISNNATNDYRLYLTDNTGTTTNQRVSVSSYNDFLLGDEGLFISRKFSNGNGQSPSGTAAYSARIINIYGDVTVNNNVPNDRLSAWVDYGWNGVAWEKGHTGMKSTHTTSEELVDGINISFSDNNANVGDPTNWVSGDYYTFGVADGVLLDGSNQLEVKIPYYVRSQRTGLNLIESSTLPTITKSITVYQPINSFTWQNASPNLVVGNNGRDIYGSGTANNPTYSTWAQSTQFVPTSAVGTQGNYNTIKSAVYAKLILITTYVNNTPNVNFVVGISSKTRVTEVTIGNYDGRREEAPEFAVGVRGYNNGSNNGDITIYYSGVVQKVVPNVRLYHISTKLAIHIMVDGHFVVSHMDYSRPIFTSESGSPPIPPISNINPFEELYVDYAASSSLESGIYSLTLYHNTVPDYYLLLGSEAQQDGHWNPKLFAVDYEDNIEVIIDNGNVISQHVGENDFTTPLTSGQYSIIYDAAAIRYSPDDTGKLISVKYTEIDYP